MAEEIRVIGAFALAFILALATVPAARRLAFATDFLDHPRDYKVHGASIPYLGGLGVLAAFLVAATVFGSGAPDYGLILALTAMVAIVSTVDDRVNLGPALRFGVQLAAGLGLWLADVRWEITGVAVPDLLITLIWIAGLCNAFNLLDNIDGATGTTVGVSAAGIGAIALGADAPQLAAVAFALSGASFAFLLFNFSRSQRIFLGDGGAVPLGFLVAALAMLIPTTLGGEALLAAVPLASVAIFDTTLVVLSRTRRGISILTGGRDHSTHRLLGVLGSAKRVAIVLAISQGLLCGLSFALYRASSGTVLIVAAGYVTFGSLLLAVFASPSPSAAPQEQSA